MNRSAAHRRPAPRAIAYWLTIVAVLIFLMVIVGGITRLTESGLSMVRWEPVSGAIPPLDEQQWHAEFDAYKATPQYQRVNSGMSLDEFKEIFFWEYIHRLIGRAIGLVVGLPLAWFAFRRMIPPGYGWRLAALLGLGGLQGVIGWWMVASGLVDRTEVSHLRLATHLLMALFLFAYTIWLRQDLLRLDRYPAAQPARLHPSALIPILILGVQLLYGAFTAGLRAGYAFASWPTMIGDEWFPTGGWNDALTLLANATDNMIVVQFIHRWLAWIVAIAALILAARAAKLGERRLAIFITATIAVQISLGIATLLSGVAIPIAVAHQGVAALLLAALVIAAHRIGSPAK